MSRDKQIDEMAKIVDDNHGFIVSSVETAILLYNAGYRKSEEVAKGIICDIEVLLSVYTDNMELSETMRTLIEVIKRYLVAELKKKYTETTEGGE